MHLLSIRTASLTTILTVCLTVCIAQQSPINTVVNRLNIYRSNTLQEKLFVHTDQSFYLTGETLWFKVYCMDAASFKLVDVSKVAYIEIIDRDKKPVLQTKIALQNDGTGSGSIFLPALLNSGTYLFRAYTNWMKNFGPEEYFQTAITIINPFTKLGLKPVKAESKYDVQFFPEGGSLVNGLESKVAFRAVDQHGNGLSFRGAIVSEAGDTVAHFTPLKFGLGNFTFKPSVDHQYKAIIKDAHNTVSTYAIPEVSREGYVMHISDTLADQIKITVNVKLSSITNPTVFLLAHARKIAGINKMSYLHNGKTEFLLDKKDLQDGVSRLTIFNDQLQPVAERLYFTPYTSNLQLDAQADQSQYATRRKVVLNIYAHHSEKPAQSNLSVAVYKVDSTQRDQLNIQDYLLLQSELRGNIESPQYYLTPQQDGLQTQAIENLLLTHGWTRMQWDDILVRKPDFNFMPEVGGHIITGQISDIISGEPSKHIVTYLSTPEKNINLYLSRSNDEGKIQFEVKNFFGAKEIFLQTNTQLDSTHKFKIFSPFSEKFSSYAMPVFDLSMNLKNAILQRSIHMQVQNTFYHEKINHFITPAIDSLPFYGKADEKYRLDDYTRFPTMEEVMREYVPGVLVRKNHGRFHFKTLDTENKVIFNDDPLVLLDGIPVFNIDKIMAFDPRKVKKLEVMTRKYYLGVLSFDGIVSYTTYRGDLANFQPDSKTLIASYEGLQLQREFFSPKYETQQSRETTLPDARTVLFWSPTVTTDNAGKSLVSFYTSDIPGKYAVVIQGLTRQGEPVWSSTILEVKDKSNY